MGAEGGVAEDPGLHVPMKLILLLCSAASLGTASFSPGEDAPYSVYEEESSVHGHALQKIKHQTGERHGPRHGPIRAHRDLSDHNGDAPETWDSSKMMHGMIIDAGSGGSRMHVYAWAPREFDKGEYGEGFCLLLLPFAEGGVAEYGVHSCTKHTVRR